MGCNNEIGPINVPANRYSTAHPLPTPAQGWRLFMTHKPQEDLLGSSRNYWFGKRGINIDRKRFCSVEEPIPKVSVCKCETYRENQKMNSKNMNIPAPCAIWISFLDKCSPRGGWVVGYSTKSLGGRPRSHDASDVLLKCKWHALSHICIYSCWCPFFRSSICLLLCLE